MRPSTRPLLSRSRLSPGALTCLLATSLALVGCAEGDAGDSSAVTRRDSAGIEIVLSERPAWPEDGGWTVATDSPVLDLGSASGSADQQLFRVRDLLRLSDDRWVVANGGTNELRIYGSDGDLLTSAGGQGEGPGEFQRLGGLARTPGDSILAWEAVESRISVFGPEGDHVRSFRLDDPPEELPGAGGLSLARAVPAGRFGDGTLLARGLQLMSGDDLSTGVTSTTTAFMRYEADGTVRGIVGTYAGPDRWMRVGEGTIEIRTLLFGRTPRLAVTGSRWYFGLADRYEVVEHAADGTIRRLVRRNHETEAVTDADVDAAIDERLEDVDDAAERAEARASYRDMPVPETFPAYDDLAVSRDGRLWVEGYRKPGEEVPAWSVFSSDGRWLGDVSLPEGFDPMWIDDEVVAGVWEDELEVEHVRAYRIQKP